VNWVTSFNTCWGINLHNLRRGRWKDQTASIFLSHLKQVSCAWVVCCDTKNICAMSTRFNSLNAKLNPICSLLALLGTHHILHVSRWRVKRIPLHLNVRASNNYSYFCALNGKPKHVYPIDQQYKITRNSTFCSLEGFWFYVALRTNSDLHIIKFLFSTGYGICLLCGTSWIFSHKLNKFLCHSSENWIQTVASERAGPGLISDKWHLWLTKWLWDRFFSEYFCSPLSISFHRGFVYMLLLQQSQKDQVYKPSKKQSLSWIQGSLAIRSLFLSIQRAGKNTK
jgi:hypothetical protein